MSEGGDQFSVLMCVYSGDRADYFSMALHSVCVAQTLLPQQVVVVCDGSLGEELDAVLQSYVKRPQSVIEVVRLLESGGLANALNHGLPKCHFDLVARMDADDISLPFRFARQVSFMSKNLNISVLGAYVEEIDPEVLDVLFTRAVPEKHNDISAMAVRRNPVSHPVVMFRKSAVLSVGGYPKFRKSQDYALWSLMLSEGFFFYNIQEVLLKMRAGDALLERRNWDYFLHELKILWYQRKIGFLGYRKFLENSLIRLTFRIVPKRIKRVLYKYAR